MAIFLHPTEVVALSTTMLLLLLNSHRCLDLLLTNDDEDDMADNAQLFSREDAVNSEDLDLVTACTLHHIRVVSAFSIFGEDLGFWVKPRSTTWFSIFVLEQYDDERWIQNFRMTKRAVFSLAAVLRPHIQKKNTRYRLSIPVIVRVACTLFKLSQGASLFICSELFAVGKSTVSKMLRDTVHAVNEVLRQEITWPTGQKLVDTQLQFQELCGLPGVIGAIDGTHVTIKKPKHGPEDYFYFKSGGYSINCQAVVDSKKRFLDLYLGMPGSINDSRVLRRSSLYHLAMHNNLFERGFAIDGFAPYLLGDSGYPLLPWLMTPHQGSHRFSVLETLFNRKLRRGRCVVENAFGILKATFRELLEKSDLDVSFIPDMITCCCILHNLLLGQSNYAVEQLLHVLGVEEQDGEVIDDNEAPVHNTTANFGDVPDMRGEEKRTSIALYLAAQRNIRL